MTRQLDLPDVRSLARLPCLLLVMVLGGCSVMQLQAFNHHAARNDHAWIATQAVRCQRTTTVCSRLHLIKGDACFTLAETGVAPVNNYTCAADAIEQGLALTPAHVDAAVQRRFQERLCESLKNLRESDASNTGAQSQSRLINAAEGLYRKAPESVPAVYYLAWARLYQLQPMLADMNPARRLPACNRLKRTINRVLLVMEAAKGGSLADWDRFADDYQRLAFDLGVAMRRAECR